MTQSNPHRQPKRYISLSNAGMLEQAIDTLEAQISKAHVVHLNTQLDTIGDYLNARRRISEHPFVQIGFYHQRRLVDALVACLDPERVHINELTTQPRLTLTQTRALVRQKALTHLMTIDELREDSNLSTASCVDNVSMAVEKIFLSATTADAVIRAYHAELIRWPSFLEGYSASYIATLKRLDDASLTRGHCDEMMINWIRNTALPDVELRRNNNLRPGGSKPTCTPR